MLPQVISSRENEMNLSSLRTALIDKDTYVVLAHSDSDKVAFFDDNGTQKERAHLIALYLEKNKNYILPLVLSELNLMKKPMNWYNEELLPAYND
jgi:hypothetical protein